MKFQPGLVLIQMRNNKGLTLVELLITLTILALVMTLIATILIQAFNVFNSSTERISTNRLTQIMVEDITQNIREYSYFDFEDNNKWKFTSDRTDDFIIKYDENKKELTLNKSDEEFRKLEGVEAFNLKSYASDQIEYYKKIGENKEIKFKNGKKILFKEDEIIFKDNIEAVILNERNEKFKNGIKIEIIEGEKIEFQDKDKNKIKFNELIKFKFDDGTEIDLNNSVFEFKIKVDTGNNSIKEVRTVYPRNFNFWR